MRAISSSFSPNDESRASSVERSAGWEGGRAGATNLSLWTAACMSTKSAGNGAVCNETTPQLPRPSWLHIHYLRGGCPVAAASFAARTICGVSNLDYYSVWVQIR